MGTITISAVLIAFGAALANSVPESNNVKVFTSGNQPLATLDWWQTAVFYQIYPRSFKDSNNDGNGDLQGIIQKLDHIKDANIDAVWLSPIYKSPQVDNGYDISDYRDVDEIYGTLADLRQLVDEAHKLGIKIILDYVPNHTSDQHKWFQASLKVDPLYDDYYVWRNATYVDGERQPPNNWLSNFGGSAWEWNEGRQQYYFHQFAPAQPDLNYRNPTVVKEMKDVLKYWLDFGVDGFRMDAVTTLFEDKELRNEPPSGDPNVLPEDYSYLKHIYTLDLNETIDMIYQFREVLDEFNLENNTYTRIMMTEVYSDVNHTMLYFGTPDGSRLGAHFTFNFLTFILNTHINFTAHDLSDAISLWLDNIPPEYTNNWVLGNHDQRRVSSRLGTENIDALNMLVAILPGIQVTYNGEEIGQENGEVTCEEGYDPQAIKNCSTFNDTSRDFERTPFQWDNSTNAGFNEGAKPWLPVSKKYVDTNLADQISTETNSHYQVYKALLQLRQEFKKQKVYTLFWYSDENLFVYSRRSSEINYSYVFNVGDVEVLVPSNIYSASWEIAVRSSNSDYQPGDKFDGNRPLKPRESIICKYTN